MKKIKFLFGIAFFILSTPFFAQEIDSDVNIDEQQEESKIALPDLTTIVSGMDSVISEEEIPDFSSVINIESVDSQIQLQMPDVTVEESESSVIIPVAQRDKEVFAEGKIGGGFPSTFIGDFSIQQDRGENPFNISFSHSATDGYSLHSLADGYNDDQTRVNIDKTINFKNSEFIFGGLYEAYGNGLQSKVENISAINQRNINAFAFYNYNLPKNFAVNGRLNGDFYNRFADSSFPVDAQPEDFSKWVKSYYLFAINPNLNVTWSNDNFAAEVYGNYDFSNDLISEKVVNRGKFGENFSWHNNSMKATANVGVVFGNTFEQKNIVPFTLGFEYSFPIYFSDRKLSVAAEGGLLSDRNTAYDLEKNYKFSAFSSMPLETSDWYGKIDVSVPFKSSYTVNLDAAYKHTAFGNGVYEPVYNDDNFTYGIYKFNKIERQHLKTNVEAIFHYKLFSVSFGWYANWLYVPALENAQNFVLALALQNELSLWGVNLSCLYSMDAVDLIPRLDLEAFVQLNNAVRLVLSVNDSIKLFSGQERNYGGKYISNGGNATLLVKFFF